MDVRLVIVTAFPPELQRWIPAVPLGESLPFPAGVEMSNAPLHVNRSLGVVGISTGMGPFRAAAGISALGYDDRFDLRNAYWMVAGIAGVDPAYGSIGSVFMAKHLIGLGGDYFLDGYGRVPHGREFQDFSPPYPPVSTAVSRGHLHTLNRGVVEWAYSLASTVTLPDTTNLQRARAPYLEDPARLPPSVRYGASVTGETFWAGRSSVAWARNVSLYWSSGDATFAVSQMEDIAFAEALLSLDRIQMANASRLIVLRSASDFCYQPEGVDLQHWFFHDQLHMVSEGFTNLVIAGMPIVRAITALPAAEFMSPLSPVERDEDEGEDEEGEDDCNKPPPAASPFSSHLQVSDGGLYLPWWIVAVVAGTNAIVLVLGCAIVEYRARVNRRRKAGDGGLEIGGEPAARVRHVELVEDDVVPRSPMRARVDAAERQL